MKGDTTAAIFIATTRHQRNQILHQPRSRCITVCVSGAANSIFTFLERDVTFDRNHGCGHRAGISGASRSLSLLATKPLSRRSLGGILAKMHSSLVR